MLLTLAPTPLVIQLLGMIIRVLEMKLVEQKQIWVQKSQKQLEVELVEKKASIDQSIKQEVARREVQASEDAVALHKLRQDITKEEVAAAQ